MNPTISLVKPSVEKPWMKFYPGPAAEFTPPKDTLTDFILKSNPEHDKPVIEYYGKTFSLNELLSEAKKAASAMWKYGLRENDQIVLFVKSAPEFLIILFAAEMIGVTVVCRDGEPVDHVEAITCANAKIAFAYDYVNSDEERLYYKDTGLEHVILLSPYTYAVKEEIPDYIEASIKKLYTNREPGIKADDRSVLWNEFFADGENVVFEYAKKDIERPLYCSYTSGSTGPSKEVLHSARTMTGMLAQLVIPDSQRGFTLKVLLTLLPPALVAVTSPIILFNLAMGSYLIMDTFCEFEDIDLEFMRHQPNQMIAIFMMANYLMNSKRIPADYDMSFLYVIGGGADTVNNKWLKEIQAFLAAHKSPAVYSMCYGLSEVGSAATNPYPGISFLDCCSGIPMKATNICVCRHGTNEELGYGEFGEVCVSGPGLMLGYSTEEDTKEKMQRHADGNVWMHTGDYGCIKENGELYIYTRGYNERFGGKPLMTTNMENKVCELPGIKDSFFVMGKDTEHEGCTVPYLFVVPETGASMEAIEQNVKAALEEYEYPAKIYQIEKREFFHFKTNRRELAQKILDGEL